MAETMLWLLLSLSLSGGLLILMIFFLCRTFRNRVSSRWQYYIWIVVIARLLLPFAPEHNLMAKLGEQAQSVMSLSTDVQEDAKHIVLDVADDSGSPVRTDETEHSVNVPGQKAGNSPVTQTGQQAGGYLLIVWMMAAVIFFLRKIIIYRSFVRFIRAGSMPVDDIQRLESLASVEAELGVHKAVELWSSPLVSSPMLIGFVRPCIILPVRELSEQAFCYTAMHELTHYRRGDMYYKWAVQLVICVHWFNPLLYFMGKNINRLCELSCDEAVAGRLQSDDQRREYAGTLLDAMASKEDYRESLASLTLSENKKLLKERLEAIMNKKNNTAAKKWLAAILTVAVTMTGLFSGSYAAGASRGRNGMEGSMRENQAETPDPGITQKGGAVRGKSDKITASQADEMALELTEQIWIWDWVKFFVPYMSEEGVKKLIPASRKAKWAGAVDMTTGKKIKFTKKQIESARRKKPAHALTCGDIDGHVRMIMQSNGDWDCISFMLPYMTRKGIRAVVRCYNSKHGGAGKRPEDYY